jgi:hypothetical protein
MLYTYPWGSAQFGWIAAIRSGAKIEAFRNSAFQNVGRMQSACLAHVLRSSMVKLLHSRRFREPVEHR